MYLHYKGQKTGKAKEVAQTLNNIEAERARNQMSKEELAQTLGICLKTYYRWIAEQSDITSAMLIRLSELFDVSVDYLLEGSKHVHTAV